MTRSVFIGAGSKRICGYARSLAGAVVQGFTRMATSLPAGAVIACTAVLDGSSPKVSDPPPPTQSEFQCETTTTDPGPSLVRRLNAREYANTIRAVLGVDVSDLVLRLPPDPTGGFGDAAVISYEHVTAYAEIAEQAVSRTTDLHSFGDCSDISATCRTRFIDTAGTLLFRRPLPAEERTPLLALFAAASAEGLSFTDGARLVLQSILQSPRFLYRIESQVGEGPVRRLDAYEIASRLSYLLWDGPPDEALWEAAEQGRLDADAAIAEQVDRMLKDPRAIETSVKFLDEWLSLSRTSSLELGNAKREETESLFKHVVWEENRSITAIFNAPYTFASRELAEFYGFRGVRDELSRYELASDQPRRGVLTHGSMLAAGGSRGSSVYRGLFLLDRLMCDEVSPPPPGLDTTAQATEPGRSIRYYSEQRIQDPVCGGCHRQFESLAHAFEPFSADGTVRSVDEHGNTYRSDGVFISRSDPDGVPFENTRAFADLVADDPSVRECTARRVAQFAFGRRIEEVDNCIVGTAQSQLELGTLRYSELIRELLTQASFRQIRTN